MKEMSKRQVWARTGCIALSVGIMLLLVVLFVGYAIFAYMSVPFRGIGSDIATPAAIPSASGHAYRVKYAISDADLEDLVSRALEVGGLRGLSIYDASKLTDKGLRALLKLRELVEVNLDHAHNLGDSSAETLAQMPAIRGVRFDGFNNLTDRGVSRLASRNLESLSVSGKEISDQGVFAVSRCASLTEVGFPDCRMITGRGARELANLPNLDVLDLSHCVGVDAEALAALLGQTSLRALTVDGLNLSDEVLVEIFRQPALTHLSIRDVKGVSEEEIDAYCRSRPDLSLRRTGEHVFSSDRASSKQR